MSVEQFESVTRKVQQLGSSTLAVTLPAEWTDAVGVTKGDEITLQGSPSEFLMVAPVGWDARRSRVTIHADDLSGPAIERAVIAQYALGRRTIEIEAEDGLTTDQVEAAYEAERQLMGLGVIGEAPDCITVRCSVHPEDFTFEELLQRLENTGQTMRTEAIKAFVRNDEATAQRALNRERQANKIFVLLLRLIYSAARTPSLARQLGASGGVRLIGYRSVAKNLELVADEAESIAETVRSTGEPVDIPTELARQLRDFGEEVDELTSTSIDLVLDPDYRETVQARERYNELLDESTTLEAKLSDLPTARLLAVRNVLVSLRQTAGYAMRNVEIAANLALDTDSDVVTIS